MLKAQSQRWPKIPYPGLETEGRLNMPIIFPKSCACKFKRFTVMASPTTPASGLVLTLNLI
ncbi:hypothetical protein BGZ61DRAFT_441634 [Ilyonectria robusta]|uniref:uncharacterized protein n=1 Tax=Ilyonectria robusta TaxID=1079257 RepID=UPI001E8EC46A|nr:uncharacterized protein BGZ61DRAFT_441634 [Ilyonectria robusta]KAH8736162.1 hypothetical protein BGZ61DRAFT_441634 [Ilyonectria robusta]